MGFVLISCVELYENLDVHIYKLTLHEGKVHIRWYSNRTYNHCTFGELFVMSLMSLFISENDSRIANFEIITDTSCIAIQDSDRALRASTDFLFSIRDFI